MNTVAYFEIQASDIEKAIQFYQNVFAWQFIQETFVPITYYRIETNGINGGLLQRPAVAPPQAYGTNAFVCSVQVESFDKTAELILENGGAVALPKFPISGRCWQGYFTDNDNNTFGIFEVDSQAR